MKNKDYINFNEGVKLSIKEVAYCIQIPVKE